MSTARALESGPRTAARIRSNLPFRLAAVDIDGTLLGPDARISEENALAIRTLKDAGVVVVLASGRSHGNMLPFHSALALTTPIVSSQGAVVRAADGTIRSERCLSPDAVRMVTSEGRRQGFDVVHYRAAGVFIERTSALTEYDQSRNHERHVLVDDLSTASSGDVHKIMWLGQPQILDKISRMTEARFFGLAIPTRTDPEYLEFVAPGVDKSIGVAAVAADLGLTARDVAAFGDGNNDVPMLAWAGLGVAVAHASDAAKAAARYVAHESTPHVALARAIGMVWR